MTGLQMDVLGQFGQLDTLGQPAAPGPPGTRATRAPLAGSAEASAFEATMEHARALTDVEDASDPDRRSLRAATMATFAPWSVTAAVDAAVSNGLAKDAVAGEAAAADERLDASQEDALQGVAPLVVDVPQLRPSGGEWHVPAPEFREEVDEAGGTGGDVEGCRDDCGADGPLRGPRRIDAAPATVEAGVRDDRLEGRAREPVKGVPEGDVGGWAGSPVERRPEGLDAHIHRDGRPEGVADQLLNRPAQLSPGEDHASVSATRAVDLPQHERRGGENGLAANIVVGERPHMPVRSPSAAAEGSQPADAAAVPAWAVRALERVEPEGPTQRHSDGGFAWLEHALAAAPSASGAAPTSVAPVAGAPSPPGVPVPMSVRGVADPATPILLTPEPESIDRLVHAMRLQPRGGAWEATVRLRPEHLGDVTLSIVVERNSVSATVLADRADVREWLQANEDRIRGGLSDHGLQLIRFHIERDPERRRDQRSDRGFRPRRARVAQRDTARFEVVV